MGISVSISLKILFNPIYRFNLHRYVYFSEYDALLRLGISDPKTFIKRHFPNEKLIQLDTVSVGPVIIDQVDANIEEVVATGTFTDIYPLLPSVFTTQDVEKLLKESSSRLKSSIHIFATTVIVSDAYLQTVNKQLEPLAENKAKETVESGRWLQSIVENKLKSKTVEIVDAKADRKSERRKKASSGKAGGGSQGRETRTKSTKKKYQQGKNQDVDSDDEQTGPAHGKVELDLVSMDDIRKALSKDENLVDMDEFIDELAVHFHSLLNKHVAEVAELLLQKHKTTNLNEIDDHLNTLITNVRVLDKGVKCLEKTAQGVMAKYLLKTLGVDFASEIFKLAAQQNVTQCSPNLTTEARQKMLQDLPKEVREPLSSLHRAVAGSSVEDFLNTVESAMSACALVLRKYDKKKDRPVVVGHREALLEQLNSTQDPALALHLTTAIIFIAATQNALHMSGRHVSNILSFLQPYLEDSTVTTLSQYHGEYNNENFNRVHYISFEIATTNTFYFVPDLVLKFLSCTDAAAKEDLGKRLEEGMQKIKTIANEYKKQVKADKIQES